MDKLKTCPFCGDDEIATFHYKVGKIPRLSDEFGVYCNGCDKSVMSDWKTEETAIEAWNKRA